MQENFETKDQEILSLFQLAIVELDKIEEHSNAQKKKVAVKVGQRGTITLDLCYNCISKFDEANDGQYPAAGTKLKVS